MQAMLTLLDTGLTGPPLRELRIELPEGFITVRELLRRRVYHEVERHNSLSSPARIDPEQQFAAACAAFERNGFFVLVGERQAHSLDEVIPGGPDMTVSFVKLLALVGG
jgi:hypothetical protein